jgi:general stress protein YciG
MKHAGKLRKGFAVISPDRQRALARLGGQAAHRAGTAHEWTGKEAIEAGRKGGQARGHRTRQGH